MNPLLHHTKQKLPCGNCQICSCWDGGETLEWKGRGEGAGWGAFLKAVISLSKNPQKSTDLKAMKSWFISSGNVASSYPAIENVAIHQTTTLNQQLTVNYSCQIIYTWPFISLSIKKPQKVQHPKQSTSRAILPLFAVMETCTQNCNYQFDETLAPQTEAPQKPHSMWVYRGESMGHDIKGKRPPLAWPAERWMLHTV